MFEKESLLKRLDHQPDRRQFNARRETIEKNLRIVETDHDQNNDLPGLPRTEPTFLIHKSNPPKNTELQILTKVQKKERKNTLNSEL